MVLNIKELPKVELHVHLDGSMKPETVIDLFEKDMTVEEANQYLKVSDDCTDLAEYIETFRLPLEVLQTKEGLKRAASDLVEMFIEDNVIYAEVRFAPQLHTNKGLSYDDIIESVLEGFVNDEIKINLILSCMRGEDTFKDNSLTIEYAHKYLGKGVCAIDLAGDEKQYPLVNYEYIFKEAKELKIPFTIHAGEMGHDESILEAIKIGAKRIGHGVNYLDKDTIKAYIDHGVTLEVCPTSNVDTNIFEKYSDHSINELYKRGVLVTINTDNRTVSNICLNDEYKRLNETFGFTMDDFIKMNKNALDAAFISIEEKEELLKRLD